MAAASKIKPKLTLDYMRNESENKYFDRKSAQIHVGELAPHIAAFANAEGGTLVIGISDKKRTLEGINGCGEDKINKFISAPNDLCRPAPDYKEEFIEIINSEGKPDRLLLLHIEPCIDQVIRTLNDRTYLRVGDKSKEMLGDNLRNLEYSKGKRHYEDEIEEYATMEDLDEELLNEYKKRIGASDVDTVQVLRARSLIKVEGGKEQITNAAILLFAKNMLQFYRNCRIRFIRIDDREMKVGKNFNVVKDKNFDLPILRIVKEAKTFIADQLRTFTRQDSRSGLFVETPEYPEFPWVEGLINAVAHRDYAATGIYIKVTMFEDRLEIESPGKFPPGISLDNITTTRFARNILISRIMTEFEIVRELNEGVKKIYSDMEEAGLPKPEYVETANTVRLILRNNIDQRTAPIKSDFNKASEVTVETIRDKVKKEFEDVWEQLDETERQILTIIAEKGSVSKKELMKMSGKSSVTTHRKTTRLLKLSVIKINGNKKDKTHTFSINKK